MSKRFENYVKKHRGDFDVFEPRDDLWTGIEKKLKEKSAERNLSFIWKAAAILVIFGLSYWAQMQIEETPKVSSLNSPFRNDSSVTITAENKTEIPSVPGKNLIIPEFAETEKYYSQKVSNTMNELNIYLVKYPEVSSNLKKDIAELDSVYRALKHDLGDNVAQEEILSAMIQNYRMKLQILEDVKNELMQYNAASPGEKNNPQEAPVL